MFKFPPNTDEAGIVDHEHFVMKFQQCTGPIMAKGLEDTAFYIFNRLAALNEVGGEPQHFGSTGRRNSTSHQRAQRPTVAAHDAGDLHARHETRRGYPREGRRAVGDARRMAAGVARVERRQRQAQDQRGRRDGSRPRTRNISFTKSCSVRGRWSSPDGNDATAVRSAFASMSDEEHATYVGRIQEYMTKAIKEAKVNSSWVQPNEGWDEAVRKFIAALLKRGKTANPFVKRFAPLAERVAQLGMVNSLTQTVLKLTVPGVPDIYQGCEIWDYSLVDPDNRRPVDYAHRKQMLASLDGADPRALLASWTDGRVKLFVVRALLHFRREHAELFRQGELPGAGGHGEICGKRGGVRARTRGRRRSWWWCRACRRAWGTRRWVRRGATRRSCCPKAGREGSGAILFTGRKARRGPRGGVFAGGGRAGGFPVRGAGVVIKI